MNTQPHIPVEQRRRAKQARFNPFSKRKKAVARQGWIESLPAARHSEAPESYKKLGQFSLRPNGRVGSASLPPPESSFSSCPLLLKILPAILRVRRLNSLVPAPCSTLQARSSTSVPSEQSAVDYLVRSHRGSAQETTTTSLQNRRKSLISHFSL